MIATSPARKTYFPTTALCWFVILGIVGFVLVRNTRGYLAAADRRLTAVVPEPDVSLEITSRMLIGQTNLYSYLPTPPDAAMLSRQKKRMIDAIESAAVTPAAKLDAIPVIGELDGANAAISRLDELLPWLAPNPSLISDAQALRDIYAHGTKSITTSQRQGLLERHEWFGQLALVYGAPAQDRQRQTLIQSAVRTMIVLVVLFFLMLGLLVVGVVLLIVGIVSLKKGRLQLSFRATSAIGPPVYLETFALWLATWIFTSAIIRFIGAQLPIVAVEVLITLFSFAVALWPMYRGIQWPQLRQDLGWHFGRGAVKEISFGILGYIAGLPILGIGFVFTVILIRISKTHPTHPILRELTGQASPISILGIFLAASFLAPLLEETMFRGALYHHLRRSHRAILSALVVSILFAAIHPQGWPVIPLLASIGFVLAMLREWRSSLLSSMTAHALNNAVAVTIVLLLLR